MKHVQCGGAGLAGMEKGPCLCARDVLGQHLHPDQGCSELLGKQEQPPEGAVTQRFPNSSRAQAAVVAPQ